jgi:flavin reductase (DIM6/NTAB) family NADH-FMN oxidoreductase RutF
MNIIRRTSRALERLVLGSTDFHQQCTLGLCIPQSEVSVQLHGLGAPCDVTERNVIAAVRPLTIGIGGPIDSATYRRGQASLRFYERGGKNRLLGLIGLRLKETIPLGGEHLCLFETRECRNYCLSWGRLWARYLQHSYKQWRARRGGSAPDFRMVRRELHSLFVFYICPRPVVLVTVADGDLANIFPMDLIGPVSTQHFSLALHSTSPALSLIERSRRIALSSVPVEQSSVAIELGQNHKKLGIDWARLPFATMGSPVLGLPVPKFSLRVRELDVEAARDLGSHKFFLARTLSDQRWADGSQLFFIHGSYQVWRQRVARTNLSSKFVVGSGLAGIKPAKR